MTATGEDAGGDRRRLSGGEDRASCTVETPGQGPVLPEWTGRTGKLGYLAKMFPRVSETFILAEVRRLQREGIPLRIYSLLPPTRDARVQPRALRVLPDVEILPQPGWWSLARFGRDLWRCLRLNPTRTTREILGLALAPSRRRFRRTFRAVVLAELMRRDRIAHLHAAWAHTPASVARAASRISGVPWSMGAHAKDIHVARRRSLAKKIASARFTTTCSRANLDLLESISRREEADLPPSSILLHHHGVDTAFFSPASPSDEAQPLIVSVGRLVPKKGFDLLLDAAAMMRDRGIRFRAEIIGEGPLRAAIGRQIRALKLDGVVALEGMLIDEEVRAAYHRASCVVLASRIASNGDRDGIPNTLAEAMACGVPVISTRLPSIEEIITDGETGLLVPPDDPAALAAAIERLLVDPEERRRLAGCARARIETAFDAATCAVGFVHRLRRTRGIEKVLYVTGDRGVPVRGSKGASVHVRALVGALTGLGVDVRVLTTRPGPVDGPAPAAPVVVKETGPAWRRLAGRIAAACRGGVPMERAILRLLDNVAIYREARRQARAWHPDVIYERYALTAVAGSFVARRLRIPHIVEVNAPLADEEERYRGLRFGAVARTAERWLLRRADRVVVVSDSLAEHSRRLGVRPERIAVLPNAVDSRLFHPGRDGARVRQALGLNGDFVVGFTGTLKPWHGVHHLLGAVAQAVPSVPGIGVLVVGDGPMRSQLEGLAHRLGIEARVRFTGHVPHDAVGDYIAACDVLVAPYGTMEDHWFSPLKVAEYLAVGRPVVASAVGQLQGLEGSPCGTLLVPPGDEGALAAALRQLARDPARRAALARDAAVSATWTWTRLAARVLSEAEPARREIWGWWR
jgi:glycosyltransferase involved in cell wall biosynthesis